MDLEAKTSLLYLAGKVDLQRFSAEKQAVAQSLYGLLRKLNPGPLGPKPRIIPLDQAANARCVFLLYYRVRLNNLMQRSINVSFGSSFCISEGAGFQSIISGGAIMM